MILAIVDLPDPDSPTRATVRPGVEGEADVVDGAQPGAAQPAADPVVLDEVAYLEGGSLIDGAVEPRPRLGPAADERAALAGQAGERAEQLPGVRMLRVAVRCWSAGA